MPFSPTRTIVALVAATTTVLAVLFGWMLQHHAHGGYGELCERNGHAWRENLPMQAGFPTSSIASLGCAVETDKGRYHFGDPREYLYFLDTLVPDA